MAEPIPQGKAIGRYIIERQLGAGGMGEVYLARDTQLDRLVALKILPAEMALDRQHMKRFMQEARTASALNQSNILTVFEIGETDSTHFIATEFIDGETLRQHMAHRRLSLHEALDIAMQVASALSAAHKAGIAHRDIKPENIMVRHDDGVVKVLDFGLAKPTEKFSQQRTPADSEAATRALVNTNPGVVMGTVGYMSPEQARGLSIDWRTDIWSLGVVLYEMIAGRLPFEGQTSSDVISNILQKEPPALTLLSDEADERLDEIAAKALTKDKEERYQSAKDLFIDLKRMKQHLDVEAEIERTVPPKLRSTKGKPGGAHKTLATAHQQPARTAAAEDARPTSSVEYIITGIKQHRKGALLIASLVAILIAATILFIRFRGAHVLTEKDTILLTDFVNTTGDTVFDGTLKQALGVHLGQSPFLNIYPDDQVRQALKFMGRQPDERITKDVGREICERQGIKALLTGTISSLGSHYVIMLEALNAQTGDAIAREQTEAESKEQVLQKLGIAASKLREKLGESLSSIQKFDAPVEQATTSSLEALKAFALGNEQRNKNSYLEAIPFYKRAIELDPNFALAYARIGVMYGNIGQPQLSAEYSRKAFELRDRVSEREKFYISSHYYSNVTREMEKNIETLELWKQAYPRDYVPRNNLSVAYQAIGQYEKAVSESNEAVRLNPNSANVYVNLGFSFLALNRYEEAKTVFTQAMAQKPDYPDYHTGLYLVAFIQGDTAAMQQQVAWYAGKPVEYDIYATQSETAAFSGQLRKAREFNQRAVELAVQHDLKEVAAGIASMQAVTDALYGDCKRVKDGAAKSLALARTVESLPASATALAFCGEAAQAQPMIDEAAKLYPTDSALSAMALPTIRATIELRRNNYAQAIQLLQSTNRYEGRSQLWVRYTRGLAYLGQHAGAEAAADFQYILDHRGDWITSPMYPLAQLGIARAAALTGDTAKARKAYQDFLALWKDADQDIPILQEAKQEYEKLK
ncbi:MAG: hypothetical protein DMF68_03960 [Acidobacteria bacterium]|nr:MAG: hypothetical protein DMF68_03960 [Acidobacteriota bacterium]